MKQRYRRSIRKMGEFTLYTGSFFIGMMFMALAHYQLEGDRASETIWNYSMVCALLFHLVAFVSYIMLIKKKEFGEARP